MRVMGRETTAEKREVELFDSVYGRAVSRFLQRVDILTAERWRAGKDEDARPIRHLGRLLIAQETGVGLIRASVAGDPFGPLTKQPVSVPDVAKSEPSDLLEALRAAVAAQLELVRGLEDDGLLRRPAGVPGWQRPGTLRHLLDHLYIQFPLHYQQIRAVSGKPRLPHWFEDWMPESSNDFYNRLFRLLPLLYTPVEGSDGKPSSVCIELTQPGGGRWRLAAEGTRATSELDCEAGAGATIKSRPLKFLDFLTGQGKVSSSGRSDLARNFHKAFPLI
ncbi:MAG: hypothetical protein WEB00_08585 [Dehalococcoidia bacterium]